VVGAAAAAGVLFLFYRFSHTLRVTITTVLYTEPVMSDQRSSPCAYAIIA